MLATIADSPPPLPVREIALGVKVARDTHLQALQKRGLTALRRTPEKYGKQQQTDPNGEALKKLGQPGSGQRTITMQTAAQASA